MKKLITTITLLLVITVASTSVYAQSVRINRPVNATEAKFYALLSQAQMHYDGHDYQNALDLTRQAFILIKNKDVAVNIATLYAHMNDGSSVVRTLKQSTITDPKAVASLITMLVDQRDLRGAKMVIDYATELADDGYIAFATGYYYDTINERADAKKFYQASLNLFPLMPEANFNMARILELEKAYDNAVALYDKVAVYALPGSDLSRMASSRASEIEFAIESSPTYGKEDKKSKSKK